MGKMKVHELAKELGLSSKDLMEKVEEFGIEAKSHLSTLEESDIKKIKKSISSESAPAKPKKASTKASAEPSPKASSKKETEQDKNVAPQKKERKPITPVIIRREVTRVTSDEDDYEVKNTETVKRNDLGVVQRKTDTSMNIKYRTEPKRPAPISNRKEQKPPVVAKPEEVVPEPKPVQPDVQPETPVKRPVTKEPTTDQSNYNIVRRDSRPNQLGGQRPQNGFNRPNQEGRPFNRDGQNNGQRPFNRDGQNNGQRPFNRDGQNGGQRPFNRDGQGNGQRPFNNRGGFNRPQENRVENGQLDSTYLVLFQSIESESSFPARRIWLWSNS